ncbi:hypothetical protein QLX08_003132 [Tetragonisca angustula]|uniref:Uncharacterized protein n=1 Tax=Tetragonisca angustula TaxID=166442 RepID=A0AAW1A8L2_9HYME
MTSPRHADRFVDCPGPCNPRNRVCRRTCVQNVMSILDELPPCIRARICQEDLLAVLVKDQEIEQESVNPHPVESAKETQRPKKDLSTTTSSRYKPDNGKQERDKDADNPYPIEQMMIEEGTQTMEEKHVQTTEQIVHEVTSRYRLVSAGTRSLRQRTEDASILVRSIANTGIRGIRTLGSTRMPSCPCSLINTAVYVGLLLLLAIFARHSPTYQIFLSSQICGILAILSWKFSGRVPI